MKSKDLFKIGDKVKHKNKTLRLIGKVVEVEDGALSFTPLIPVQWNFDQFTSWELPVNIEFAENPIQRMKRRYKEEIKKE